ncbi:Spc98 family-domain-containing protein [Flagelloscypha sp. PMI_526]|nr:Spc98 family-domain-containing protein [Flagelloscypha sp. PMI_526]
MSLGDSFQFEPLEPISPHFFVSPISDQPRNPVLRTLRLREANKHVSSPLRYPIANDSSVPPESHAQPLQTNDQHLLWKDIAMLPIRPNKAVSWDVLMSKGRKGGDVEPSPFLSEQADSVFSAARAVLDPPLVRHLGNRVYLAHLDLLESLSSLCMGFNSTLFQWDSKKQLFVPPENLVIDGLDERMSSSILSRFVAIGSSIARLELIMSIIRGDSNADPTVFSFSHSILTVVTYMRRSTPIHSSSTNMGELSLYALWSAHEIVEVTLEYLTGLCGCSLDRLPSEIIPPPVKTVPLLSAIYGQLFTVLEPRNSTFQHLCQSLGMCLRTPADLSFPSPFSDSHMREDSSLDQAIDEEFPDFFGRELMATLHAGRRSYELLRETKPDHRLTRPSTERAISWFWTRDSIESAWHGQPPSVVYQCDDTLQRTESVVSRPMQNYKKGLEGLEIFDKEPGENPDKFIVEFPATLPPITPTLSELALLVLDPLRNRAEDISRELLLLFLSPTSTPNIRLQLELLRSYLLVTLPLFKRRLVAALFSDTDDPNEPPTKDALSLGYIRPPVLPQSHQDRSWPVGLSLALLSSNTWPPNGTDLSFFLRSVIVDSRELQDMESEKTSYNLLLLREAETRIGFAIRDLPTDPGQDDWLNPCSTECLDFLAMDYKPPRPLDLFITQEVLSKYQRLSTFILRILRVEVALDAVFRMIRDHKQPPFPTLDRSRRILLHLWRSGITFIRSLSSYLFDVAIGIQFNAFFQELDASADEQRGFRDVFTLALGHSSLLDDVLSACLLRSAQGAVGDIIRQILELLLQVCVLVGDQKLGRVREAEAAETMETQAASFTKRMIIFTTQLRRLVDKFGGETVLEDSPQRGVQLLSHLLIRLDFSGFYRTVSTSKSQ